MLTYLSIKNYALIDDLSVDFSNELTIITGETGAGKSILLGGLGLVLGNRVDSTALKYSGEKCVIEAHFAIEKYNLEGFFDSHDLDFENDTIIRREILPSGKSRAFVNDTPTTLQVLTELGDQLIDVHSQHQTLKLSDKQFQFQLLDSLGRISEIVKEYQAKLEQFNNVKAHLKELRSAQQSSKEQYDYNKFLFDELSKAGLSENEQEEIEMQLDKLNNIEAITSNLTEALSLGLNEDLGLQDRLIAFSSTLKNIAEFGKDYEALSSRINSLKIEFDDVLNELEMIFENINFDSHSYEKLNERIQVIYDLQKKHAVNTIPALLEIQDKLDLKVQSVDNLDNSIINEESKLAEIKSDLDAMGLVISEKRKNTVPVFIEKLEQIVAYLGMENTRFKIDLIPSENYYQNGKDELQFLISANKGAHFGPVKKIASGGELSRIMVAIKAILSESLALSTIIFDEIDAGVSGDVAKKVGNILTKMGGQMQVIAITHLPQIAARGKQHLKIFKTERENSVVTKLKVLNNQDRILEIAEMLGSKNITSTAVEHAKQLLN